MNNRSYIFQLVVLAKELILDIFRRPMLRRLTLYPTELRALSATYIFQLSTRLHAFYTFNQHVSFNLTKHDREKNGRAVAS
jgi:hypothetical protein